ncbi:hypothetical protein EYF80_016510 [Liparis tanakae]|uniref:Uncharacterized protein n=1 Tax=Liparis tanakae TaxID=230148 RepID=A0A4Z2I5Q4_9TELE|nr:hypothetical protein EYF80_016510 [Liparis tanakae]
MGGARTAGSGGEADGDGGVRGESGHGMKDEEQIKAPRPWWALTLGADHDDRDVRAVSTQLAVELVELLEAALVLQAENQDHCVDPAAELEEREEDDVLTAWCSSRYPSCLTSLSSGMDLLRVHSWLLAIFTREGQRQTVREAETQREIHHLDHAQ